jgi:hypothetical protein
MNTTMKMRRFTGGFAIGLGLGTLGLAIAAFQNPSIPHDFAGATALIGMFCMAIGRVCVTDRAEESMDHASYEAAA